MPNAVHATGIPSIQSLAMLFGVALPPMEVDSRNRGSLAIGQVTGVFLGGMLTIHDAEKTRDPDRSPPQVRTLKILRSMSRNYRGACNSLFYHSVKYRGL